MDGVRRGGLLKTGEPCEVFRREVGVWFPSTKEHPRVGSAASHLRHRVEKWPSIPCSLETSSMCLLKNGKES